MHQIHAGLDGIKKFKKSVAVVGWIASVDTKITGYNKKDQSLGNSFAKLAFGLCG